MTLLFRRAAVERRILIGADVLLLSGPVVAWPADTKPSQEKPQDEQPADKPKDEKPKEPALDSASAASDGFVIQFENGEYQLILGMVAQADGRFSLDDSSRSSILSPSARFVPR
jgi:hypothetical protein